MPLLHGQSGLKDVLGLLPPTFRRAVGLNLTELKLLLRFPQLLFGLLQPLLKLELLALKGKRGVEIRLLYYEMQSSQKRLEFPEKHVCRSEDPRL